MNLSEGTWSGDVASCNAGDISSDGRDNALRLVNLYRWLANLDPITADPTNNQKAQQCALIMRANNMLSHMPPTTWMCYTADGADAAGKCNISSGPGVQSVDGYMVDPGNPTTLGHRRWLLSNMIGPTGFGSTDRSSCLWTFGTMHAAKMAWTAWPPPGVIPIAALGAGGFIGTVDTTGWSLESDTINLASATVTVMSGGMNMPVTVNQLGSGYGSRYAINFIPQGWKSTAGQTYSVAVSGVTPAINYDVQIVACP